jgi:hypothetical protein
MAEEQKIELAIHFSEVPVIATTRYFGSCSDESASTTPSIGLRPT